MNSLYDFYNSILNIEGKDKEADIKAIVFDEREKLADKVLEFDGFCKYLANQIEYRIVQDISGVHTYKIDLNDLVYVDHTILIAEYMTNSNMKRLLINPSFSQFVRKDNSNLVKLVEWPGDKIDRNLLSNLLTSGVVEVNNDSFKNYLNSFGRVDDNFSLDNYLLEGKIGHTRK